MGQSSSQMTNHQASPQMANFYHICNIIPDTPEHHHLIWTPPQSSPTSTKNNDNNTITHTKSKSKSKLNTPPINFSTEDETTSSLPRYHNRTDCCNNNDNNTPTDYTTDDESDRYRERVRRVRRQRHLRSPQPNDSLDIPITNAQQVIPKYLDRRYDLDIAPSLVNMDLRFNGAHMVVSALYNIFVCKFGYHHMLSVQMLFWMTVHKYYQIHNIDSKGNYKLSLGTFLEVVKELSLCSERELSIYTDVAQKNTTHHNDHAPTSNTPDDSVTTTATTFFPVTAIATQRVFSAPFYRMQHYYVPNGHTAIKCALLHDHLVLANLTLFSNFLSSRQGVIRLPNSSDQSAGMIVVTIVGYQEDMWIVKFPFGLHWGDNGFGYVPFDYFDRYNRDRWIIDVEECGEPPEYMQQRKKDQMRDGSGLLSAHMDDQIQHTLKSAPRNYSNPSPQQQTKPNAYRKQMRRRVF